MQTHRLRGEVLRTIAAAVVLNVVWTLLGGGSPVQSAQQAAAAPGNAAEAAVLGFVNGVDTHWRKYTSCPFGGGAVGFQQVEGLWLPVCAGGQVVWEARAPRPACTILVQHGDYVLMGVRAREPFKGMLDFPGGFIRVGESVTQGALREVHEEYGITPESCAAITDGVPELYGDTGIPCITFGVACTITAAQAKSVQAADDVGAAMWVAADTLADQEYFGKVQGTRVILEAFLARVKQPS
eukprot:TRINITY_DN28911_c0_g1_i1.p2 TRINITY_DN28911_c0_g1~~TRINITY_DN28911_c0_g1_i1.p2  ORF type:complete len:240 (+),score=73.01 TRINITY_DN28911_c0_g1_i1:73-792(+)